MLATLNSKQIVDEIVKDTMKDNDPHDAIQISPDVVQASRAVKDAPTLAPEITPRMEPKYSATADAPAAAPSVDTAIRAAAGDKPGREQRSSVRKLFTGALVTMLLAGGSAAATVAWDKHGETARQMLAAWTPVLTSLLPSTSQTAPVAAVEAAPPAAQAATDQPTDQAVTPPPVQAAAAPDATPPDASQSLQSMTRDMAAMAQQIEQLKANIAELKASQEQMAHDLAKAPAPKPVAEVKPVDPRARAALPPRPPAAPVRKPKPVITQTYAPAYAPAPVAPPPTHAAAVPPPPAPAQAVADDDGPIVRPPMPLH
ncbi:hypothetical protein JQ625_14315 [Bradyrhizobium diazoefficiens]|nr:hypothetical protein [Bradyrhizobium diazoefficiens]MBR0776008.1 hypothetical protein [Bradyrhizobium diazoefficiens]